MDSGAAKINEQAREHEKVKVIQTKFAELWKPK
jgi:hypothetical protein